MGSLFQEKSFTGITMKVAYVLVAALCISSIQAEVRIFGVAGTGSYQEAVDFCKSQGFDGLATRAEYCPNGPRTTPVGGQYDGDLWSPVADSHNQWVHTGKDRWPECELHTEVEGGKHQKPEWGTTSGWIGPIMCAKHAAIKPGTIKVFDDGAKRNYHDAIHYCQTKGFDGLATREEYCPNGPGTTPVGGQYDGDLWSPVADSHNQWVHTGKDRWPECELHTEVEGGKHGKPEWGTTTGWTGPIMCSKHAEIKPGTTRVFYDGSKRNYHDATHYCKQKGFDGLATIEQYCPNGPDSSPVGGQYTGDRWSPVADSHNQWVHTGKDRWPECELHTEVEGGKHGKPEWGTTTGWTGPIMCSKHAEMEPGCVRQTIDDSPCKFPFYYQGNFYTECIDLDDEQEWCATTIADYEGYPFPDEWGYCKKCLDSADNLRGAAELDQAGAHQRVARSSVLAVVVGAAVVAVVAVAVVALRKQRATEDGLLENEMTA